MTLKSLTQIYYFLRSECTCVWPGSDDMYNTVDELSAYIGLLVRYRHTQLVPVHYYRTTCPTLEIQIKYAYRNMTLSYIPNNPDELSGVYGRLVRCTVGHTVRLSWTTSSAAGHVVRPGSNTSTTFGTEEVVSLNCYLVALIRWNCQPVSFYIWIQMPLNSLQLLTIMIVKLKQFILTKPGCHRLLKKPHRLLKPPTPTTFLKPTSRPRDRDIVGPEGEG